MYTEAGLTPTGEILVIDPPDGVVQSPADEMTLMQYVGAKDAEGTEIYEGDILKDQKGQFGQVLCHRNYYLIEWTERDKYSGARETERFYDECFGMGSVVGNVHEHPELLN